MHSDPGKPTLHKVIDDFVAKSRDGFLDFLGFHEIVSHDVHNLALVICHVVILEEVLANIEVVRLDLALRSFDLPRQ